MKCPQCGAASLVLTTRALVNRRRECFNGHKFSTREVLVSDECIAMRAAHARQVLREKGYLR